MDPRTVFSPDDLAAIGAAARSAELSTRGEVVPYIVGRCDPYRHAAWCGAALGALALAALAAVVDLWIGPWGRFGPVWLMLPPLAGAGLGYWLADRVPAVTRRLVASAELDRRVRQRAELAFLREEVFETRDRTGVLLLLALFERRAVVLADTGILSLVEASEWQAVINRLTAGLRDGRPAAAMVEAVDACGQLLARAPALPDDRDEIPDDVRLSAD